MLGHSTRGEETTDSWTGPTVAAGSAQTTGTGPTVASGGERTSSSDDLEIVEESRYLDRVELSRGGMGRIFSARDRRLQRTVAIKELRTYRPELVERFEREARLTARLQHPSIVSIHEAGRWASGEPFYAMKLVPGRPLDVVVAEATTFAGRLALLPHVLAVADALAYAHRERVIHRDLKPQNVMIGEFGETVVIDWGLAKDLAAGAAEPTSGSPTSDPMMTTDGDVLGTPAYMPPEQAEGTSVDERADVYSIGAMLYQVLTGVAPYGGTSAIDILVQVREGSCVPLPTREPEVPHDLAAIVDRAMALDPALRYPTARELADDLRKFQSGQLVGAHRYSAGQLFRRWLRRHRAVLAVAMIAVTVLVVVGVAALLRILAEQERSEVARTLAETKRADAEEIMEFMLDDLVVSLEPLGKLDLLGAIAEKATAYYARRPGVEEPRSRIITRRHLGDVLQAKGDLDGALRAYHDSLALGDELLARASGDPRTLQRERAQAFNRIGEVLGRQGDTAGALAANRSYFEVIESIAAISPGSVLAQRDLLVGHVKIGDDLRAMGNLAGALEHYRTAFEIATQVAKVDSDPIRTRSDLLVGHERLATTMSAMDDSRGALTEARAGLRLARELATPDDASSQLVVAMLRGSVSDILRNVGDKAAALDEAREGARAIEALVAHDPSNTSWHLELALARRRTAHALLATGEPAAALALLRKSQLAATELAAREGAGDVLGKREVALHHQAIGDVLTANRDSAALAEYRAALVGFAWLAAANPNEPELTGLMANAQRAVGDALAARDPAAALIEYRAARPLLERLAASAPQNAETRTELAAVECAIGATLVAVLAIEVERLAGAARK